MIKICKSTKKYDIKCHINPVSVDKAYMSIDNILIPGLLKNNEILNFTYELGCKEFGLKIVLDYSKIHPNVFLCILQLRKQKIE